MELSASTPAAVAPPVPEPTPEPVSAVDQAVANGDQAAFRDARLAERAGKPLPVAEPAPETEPVPAATAPPESKPVSKRQQEINDKIREAVERATGPLQAELARLKAPVSASAPASPASAAAPAQPAADPEPKEEQFETYGAFVKAQARWEVRQELQAQQTAARAEWQRQQVAQETQTRADTWNTRYTAAQKAIPDFDTRVKPDTPMSLPMRDYLIESERGPELLLHLSEHPDDAQRLAVMPPEKAFVVLRDMAKLEANLEAAAKPAPLKTLTDAPPPAAHLGHRPADPSDPIDSAVSSGDQTAFKAARLRQRAAMRR